MNNLKVYLNLTNGIEYIEQCSFENPNFIRIQSTKCEQKDWDFIIQDLDNDFILHSVLGYQIIVYDKGARKKVSRALYQGIEFIKFVFNKFYLNKTVTAIVKSHNCTNYFEQVYKNLDKRTLKKLEYFKKFVNTTSINISCISEPTDNDGNTEYYKEILLNLKKNKG